MSCRTGLIAIILMLQALAGCSDGQAPAPAATSSVPAATAQAAADPHSFANFDVVRVRHLALDGRVDFDRRQLDATVRLELERSAGASELVLDTRDLEILAVTAADAALEWQFGTEDDDLGTALRILLPETADAVSIRYRSSPQASGLQWLEPAQTSGRRQPFMFSQSQAIHARSWIPLQDTPAVRFTFEATLQVPPALRAVMGASNDPEAELDGEFSFSMPQPIPSYLMALAVGELEFAAISERAGVYAEPEVLEAAAAEFADTEAMIEVSESLFGPYRWGRYDLLILPPSFPFGGMENPRLSFITPTVIAGDRSLVSLIAHELAHSWSGNLVTNAAWDHMWLNEGFTVYLEAQIMEALYGPERRAMEAVLGHDQLIAEFETLAPRDQHLVLDLAGRDADDAFSSVPYEKGRLFLVFLREQMGSDAFARYLRGYFDRHAFTSLTTQQFVADLAAHWPSNVAFDQAALDAWLHAPGLPENAVLPRSDALQRVEQAAQRWLNGELAVGQLPTAQWSPQHWLHFLNGLPALSDEQLRALDQQFGLTRMGNAEIVHAWLRIAIAHRYEPAIERMRAYMQRIGRLKLIEPLYRDLMAQPWGQPLAQEIYAGARPGYHPLTQSRIDAIVR